jgi:hypothetical protein
MSRSACAGALAAVVLALAGCGAGAGGGADAAAVKRTVQHALAALANGDGAAFCALATRGARAELQRTTPGATCPEVVRRISDQLSPTITLALRHARVGAVTLRGNRATIHAGQITSTQGSLKGFLQAAAPPTTLARQANGAWRIAG